MRRAYVGLSGPLAYDYKNQGDKPDPRDGSAPNPLLEDSLGLLVFYDEIIFLSPQLCPQNMRHLPYVKFLNQRTDFTARFPAALQRAEALYKEREDPRDCNFGSAIDLYRPALGRVTGQPLQVNPKEVMFVPDNHTHGFYVSKDCVVSASSLRFQAVLADWITRDAFELEACDVISNSGSAVFYQAISRQPDRGQKATSVAQRLISKRLPNYLQQLGPYHECLEELRNHRFVESARAYLDELVFSGNHNDLDKVATEISELAKKYRDDVFRRHLAGSNEYWVIGKAATTEAAGLLIPGVGFVSELISERSKEKERARMRWAGFVTDVEDGSWKPG